MHKNTSTLEHLLTYIEEEIRLNHLWKDYRSHTQDEWLPLGEWIQFVMIPRDRSALTNGDTPLNYSV